MSSSATLTIDESMIAMISPSITVTRDEQRRTALLAVEDRAVETTPWSLGDGAQSSSPTSAKPTPRTVAAAATTVRKTALASVEMERTTIAT